MFGGVNRVGGFSISGVQENIAVKEISTVEEFGAFLKENTARIEQGYKSLSLIFGGYGAMKTGSQIWTKPDPTTEICVYVQSNNIRCGIDFDLPRSIVVKGPMSSARVPASLLTKQTILSALGM
jgi:hypothetical protein